MRYEEYMKIIAKTASRAARGKNLTLVWGVHPFPAGKILVALSAEGLCWLGINCGPDDLAKNWKGAELVEDKNLTEKTAKEIAKLWPGDFKNLSVPLVLHGTPFQVRVWRELLKIKSGTTATYAAVARKIGSPKAVRAVGTACGKNNLCILVPCHRVVSASGGKVNYAWGPKVKIALLKGEGAL